LGGVGNRATEPGGVGGEPPHSLRSPRDETA
jgi:hypothetical protein